MIDPTNNELKPSAAFGGSSKDSEEEIDSEVVVNEDEDDPDSAPSNACSRAIERVQGGITGFYEHHKQTINWVLILILVIAIHVFLFFAIRHSFEQAKALLVMVCVGWVAFVWYGPLDWFLIKVNAEEKAFLPFRQFASRVWNIPYVAASFYVLIGCAMLVWVTVDAWGDTVRLTALGGLLAHILICILLSTNIARIKWRPVFWGLLLQMGMGVLILRWQAGHDAFKFVADQTVVFLDYTNNGTSFVYGFLADPGNLTDASGKPLVAPLAFSVGSGGGDEDTSLQVVVYFGAIVGALFHLGVIQFVLVRVAVLMQFTMGTTAAESLNAAACVFLGQTEAALLIQPCLATMTDSEIHAVMTAGYACIAGSLFAVYIKFGACATYLLSATVMSAPASMAVAKMLMPETEKSQQADVKALKFPKGPESGVLECISNGAVQAAGYVLAIVANLIVIMALLAFVDAIFAWAGDMVGFPNVTLEQLVGYVFYPLAYVMGASDSTNATVHHQETLKVAELMGVKTVINEFVAYQKLGCLVSKGELGTRARMIATYALCGFSNIGSIGIQLGIMGGMCPERKASFARCAVRGLIAGSMACFMTACVAGLIFLLFLCRHYSLIVSKSKNL